MVGTLSTRYRQSRPKSRVRDWLNLTLNPQMRRSARVLGKATMKRQWQPVALICLSAFFGAFAGLSALVGLDGFERVVAVPMVIFGTWFGLIAGVFVAREVFEE
jgi:hypothetical protein